MKNLMSRLVVEQDHSVPVIAIDGQAGAGKGTVRQILCKRTGWNSLDSGALYRIMALLSIQGRKSRVDELVVIARSLRVRMTADQVFLFNQDVTQDLRGKKVEDLTPIISRIKEVREELRVIQLSMRMPPGLVADGRDMGELFDTPHKFYLSASIEERAKRRWLQRRTVVGDVRYARILEDMRERDRVDLMRRVSPAKPHPEALVIDTDKRSAEQVADIIVKKVFSDNNTQTTGL